MIRSEKGFTITEALVAMAIVMIFILCAVSIIESYQKLQADQKDKLRARTLLTQVAADVASAPQRYPTITLNGQAAGYVLCFDQNLSSVPYNSTDLIGYEQLSDLEPNGTTDADRPRFCNSRFEVRVEPVVGDPELRIAVYQYSAPRSTTTVKLLAASN